VPSPSDADLIERISRPSSLPGDVVDARELRERLGLTSEHLARRIFAELDADGDGVVQRHELVDRVRALMNGGPEDRLLFAFRVHDEDANGFIDRAELLRMLHISLAENRLVFGDALVEDLADALFEHADVDGDGQISFEEFSAAIAAFPGVLEQMTLGDLRWLGLGPSVAAPKQRVRADRSDAPWMALLVLYGLANVALFAYAVLRYRELGANVAVQIARGCGLCLNLHASLLLVPMMRRTLTLLGRGALGRILIDDHVAFHRLVGNAAVALALVHAAAHAVNAGMTGAVHVVFGWAFVTGALLLIVHEVMAFFARDAIRRSGRFEIFAWTHRLWPVWLGLLLVHGPASWVWLAVPATLYLLDRFLGQRVVRTVLAAADVLPSGVTRLTIDRPDGFTFSAGDYVFVRIPKLAPSEWHPFTISSAPERSDALTLHVRSAGNWTSALHLLAKERDVSAKPIPIELNGPYGTATARIFDSKVAILVAAGIGVTPFASVLASLLLRALQKKPWALERVHFVWVCKEQRSFEWFAELLAVLERAAPERFCVHIYMDAGRADLPSSVLRAAMDALYAKNRADLVTGLCAQTTLGAPRWDELIANLAERHRGVPVDAFFCGPPGLAKIVRAACSRADVSFRQEHF
jgi:NAD(P)H-flavin reductase/Ca2+-binding EF-hand superfamily protein